MYHQGIISFPGSLEGLWAASLTHAYTVSLVTSPVVSAPMPLRTGGGVTVPPNPPLETAYPTGYASGRQRSFGAPDRDHHPIRDHIPAPTARLHGPA